MGFFNRIFGHKALFDDDPQVVFGRYSDAYKTTEQYQFWDESITYFENEDYINCYKSFFKYLKSNNQENVSFLEKGDTISFQIFQGSKKIEGIITPQKIKAEAKIAVSSSLNVGFLRRLIELNYNLKYSRFALDKADNLTLLFDSYLLDGSPYKLFYALKEVAINADKQDDLLVEEFDALNEVNTGHIQPLAEAEKKIKVVFLKSQLTKVLKLVNKPDNKGDQLAGGAIYLLLNVSYKLDYLIKPEGKTMDTFERIHRTYFANDGKSVLEKSAYIKGEFETILELDDLVLAKEMYAVISSFGMVNPNNHTQFVSFVQGELHNMDWYLENNHHEIAKAIPGYIIGFCLFNFALPLPDKEYLKLYYRITEPDYFEKLGFKHRFYNSATKVFNQKLIIQAIEEISRNNILEYPLIKPNTSALSFKTASLFAKSYVTMIRDLDLTKKDK